MHYRIQPRKGAAKASFNIVALVLLMLIGFLVYLMFLRPAWDYPTPRRVVILNGVSSDLEMLWHIVYRREIDSGGKVPEMDTTHVPEWLVAGATRLGYSYRDIQHAAARPWSYRTVPALVGKRYDQVPDGSLLIEVVEKGEPLTFRGVTAVGMLVGSKP